MAVALLIATTTWADADLNFASVNPTTPPPLLPAESRPRAVVLAQPFTVPTLDYVPKVADVQADVMRTLAETRPATPMTEAEVLARSGREAVFAQMIEAEIEFINERPLRAFGPRRAKLIRRRQLTEQILGSIAGTTRNSYVAETLQSYYSLAAASAKLDIVRQTIEEVDGAVAEARRLKDAGVAVEVTPETLTQQRAELVKGAIALQAAVKKSSRAIHAKLNLDDAVCAPLIRPLIDWNVRVEEVDLCEELRLGMNNNAELRLLDEVGRTLNAETVDVVEAYLPLIQPIFAISSGEVQSRLGLLLAFICPPKPSELTIETRRRQIGTYNSWRRRDVKTEILSSIYTLRAAGRRISFDQQRWELAQDQLRETSKKRRNGIVPDLVVRKATIEVLQREQDVVDRVVEYYLALVQLRYLQDGYSDAGRDAWSDFGGQADYEACEVMAKPILPMEAHR